jgi:hypothetical protein
VAGEDDGVFVALEELTVDVLVGERLQLILRLLFVRILRVFIERFNLERLQNLPS